MDYDSLVIVGSQLNTAVRYRVAKMSFGRRLELMRQVREIAGMLEFHQAGDTEQDRINASVLSAEIDRLYVRWGLLEIEGLTIDGAPATPDSLAQAGPEDFFREALQAVKQQCGLSEAERKN